MSKGNEKKASYLKWYSDFKQERDRQNDYWNLAKSSSRELEAMVMTFEQSMTVIEKRIASGRTYCLVFDAKKYVQETVVDALIKYRICDELNSDEEYFMRCDSKVKMTKLEKKNDKSNQVSKVKVSSDNWPLGGGARLNLSSKDYCTFLKNCEQRRYFVDLIVLTLNSNKEFKNADIMSLLKEIKDKQYNFVMLLNDAPNVECTWWKECDVCYGDIRQSLVKLDVPTDDRFIKISAKAVLENHVPNESINTSLEKTLELLKEELTMENVVGRYLKDAQLFVNNFDEVKKMIQETKRKVKNDASNCEKMLKSKSIETQKTINDSKNATECLLEDKIQSHGKKVDNIDLKFVKQNVNPLIDKSFNQFQEQFKKQIKSMIKTGNSNLESYITEMYFNKYNEGSYEFFLKRDIEECLKDVLKESKSCDRSGNLVLEKFLQKTKGYVTNTFKSITSSFENFRDNLSKTVVKKFEIFQETINSITEKFTACLDRDEQLQREALTKKLIEDQKKEFADKLDSVLLTIDNHIKESDQSIREAISRYTKIIIDHINKYENEDMYQYNIKDLFDHDRITSPIVDKIKSLLSDLKSTIVRTISDIGSDSQTEEWIKNINVLIERRVFNRQVIDKYQLNVFSNLNLRSNDLYTISETSTLKKVVSTSLVLPILAFSFWALPIEALPILYTSDKKIIKRQQMITEVRKTETDLIKEVDSIMHEIPRLLKECINTKSWQKI